MRRGGPCLERRAGPGRAVDLFGVSHRDGVGLGFVGAADNTGEFGVQVAAGGVGGNFPDGGGDQQGAEVRTISCFIESDEEWHVDRVGVSRREERVGKEGLGR